MTLEHLWWEQIKTQPTGKNHSQEEILEQIKESADCTRENEIIRRAINSLLDQISCAFEKQTSF
jgi:hypothetical protein